MYARAIVPADFAVPQRIEGNGFHLRMLTVHDVVKDFAAVVASAPQIARHARPGSTWPEGLTLEENLIDLGWHQREFTLRHSFAYTVMNDDESLCLGCCYIYPSDRPEFQVMARYWARTPEWEQSVGAVFRASLKEQWTFTRVAFPGRDIAWDKW